MIVRFAVALTAIMTLTSCGGGGGGSSNAGGPNPPGPSANLAPPLYPAEAAAYAVNTAAAAATNGPTIRRGRSITVTQSSNRTDQASVSFSGNNVRLQVNRPEGALVFDTARHSAVRDTDSSVPGLFTRIDAISPRTASTSSFALVTTSRLTDGSGGYLAFGYWLHSDWNGSGFTPSEIGAFAAGTAAPRMDLPLRGRATFTGFSSGLFTYEDARQRQGGFINSDVRLTADFGTRSISGCLGCNGGVMVTGENITAGGQLTEFEDRRIPARVRLGTARFGADGAFRSASARLERDDRRVATTSGSWGGQFTEDGSGAAGTAGVRYTYADGARGSVLGFWAVDRN